MNISGGTASISLVEYSQKGSKITPEVMKKIKEMKPGKIFIEQVRATSDGKEQVLNPITIVMTY